MSALKYVQAGTLYQAGAGNIIGAVTIVLTSFSDIYGNILTMTDFGGKGYGTMEPDTNNEESFTFTGVTANTNGTYTLTGISSVLAKSPYTETSGTVRQHSGGTKVVISDTTAFWNTFVNKNNNETVLGKYTFPNGANRITLDSDTDTATATDLVTLGQLSRQAIAGASNASTTVKGIVELATQAETDARSTTGGTGALLVPTPDTQRSTLLSDYKVDTGAANAYVITPVPALSAYTVGQMLSFKAVNANTTASTLNVNGLGAKNIFKIGGSALSAGDIAAGQLVVVQYDGTQFQMIQPVANPPIAQNGATIYAADAGSTDAYAITLSPVPPAYVAGMVVNFKANTVNTGAATLNVNSLGAKTIKKNLNIDLADNDILAGQLVSLIYDGTNFQMISPISNVNGYIGTQSLVNGSNTITAGFQNAWRMCVISGGCDGGTAIGDVIIFKTGKLAGTMYVPISGAPSFFIGWSATFDGSTTITMAPAGNSTTSSGSAYYYR